MMNIDPAAVLALQCDLVTRLAEAEGQRDELAAENERLRAMLDAVNDGEEDPAKAAEIAELRRELEALRAQRQNSYRNASI